ncbi:type II toxin-antitoxin system VapC family toxin [uncultured Thiothrix sp.]|uniref:type II toxin-antitoxin system VapC family toxin n=1 Tax=uncultured Thiothrix sp. TaxID=223185 RepID=UPI002615C64F|nr:type II toxin-antitoxin system VapC family toxin [uncultured Thiothrix sp.]
MSHQRWVLDASAAVSLVMRQPDAGLFLTALEASERVFVPHLYFAECTNALWKYVSHQLLDLDAAVNHLEELMALPDEIIQDQKLMLEALSLASQTKHPVYDAVYLVLARRYAAGLLTKDKRLNQLATQLGIKILSH